MNTFEQKDENLDFWKEWTDITDIEKQAIESIIEARKLIVAAVPEEALVAIYIKGSFTRREMVEGSDVDIVPIVTENEYQGAIFGVNDNDIHPATVIPLYIQELKNNELATKSETDPDTRAKPDRLLKFLDECKIIYGNSLNIKDYPIRSDKEALKDEIEVIRNGYIPLYLNNEIPFEALLKEVFWLVELEQTIKGKDVNHNFASINGVVTDPDHIIHQAYELRGKPDREKEDDFITNLEKYLENK